MLTRHEIVRRADDDGVDAAVAERDYVLAHIVARLHRATPADGARLVFKGGTALRLVHVGADYRYSADLDFSVIDGSVEAALDALVDALGAAARHAELPLLELTTEQKPRIAYVGPLSSEKTRALKLDIQSGEHVERESSSTKFAGSGRTCLTARHSTYTQSMRSQQKSCAA